MSSRGGARAALTHRTVLSVPLMARADRPLHLHNRSGVAALRRRSSPRHRHSPAVRMTDTPTSPRGMAGPDFGALLWGDDPQGSTMLPYVRDHAERMVARVREEDPRTHYVALKQVHDVCIYKRLPQPAEAPAPSPLAASISSSFSSLTSSRRGPSTTEGLHLPGHHEFRGITRVPGTVDAIMDVLASESPRETYWMALNTLKDVRAAALLSTARLQSQQSIGSEHDKDAEDPTAFPRWSRKYMAMKLSKHSSQVKDCCFAEYAMKTSETNGDGHTRRRGFVYRRSVSEEALGSAPSTSADMLNKTRVAGAGKLYLHDWLFDVVETQEPFMCKLVLTCSVYIPPSGRAGTTSRSEFREFCTELLAGARRALTHQWKDQAAHAGIRSNSWRKEGRCCSVCSAQFSLLRKRHTCRSCGCGVCSRCCSKTAPGPLAFTADASRSAFGSSLVATPKPSARGQRKECLLCAQFGADSSVQDAEVASVSRRLFSTSMASMSTSSTSTSRGFTEAMQKTLFEMDMEGRDRVHPDLELRTTASVSGSRSRRSQRSGSSNSSQPSITEPDEEDESDEDVRPYTPRLDMRATTSSVKMRTASTDSAHSARSSPGIVLLSDLETLSLSGSFHRASSMASRPSSSMRLPAKSSAPTPAQLRAKQRVEQQMQRQERAASEDNVVLFAAQPRPTAKEGQESSASTVDDEEVYSEDDLANFTLKLL